jgi:hypothetical protein
MEGHYRRDGGRRWRFRPPCLPHAYPTGASAAMQDCRRGSGFAHSVPVGAKVHQTPRKSGNHVHSLHLLHKLRIWGLEVRVFPGAPVSALVANALSVLRPPQGALQSTPRYPHGRRLMASLLWRAAGGGGNRARHARSSNGPRAAMTASVSRLRITTCRREIGRDFARHLKLSVRCQSGGFRYDPRGMPVTWIWPSDNTHR